ncbi:hypothetical protein Bca4012_070786 [Brassica carinata]
MVSYDEPCSKRQRLLVVANRLPVSAKRTGENSWSLEMSPGGLVSGLLGVAAEFETKWVGWPGVDVYDVVGKNALSKSLADMKCIPVFLEEVFDQYYNGYCNGILWPILHHMGLPQEDHKDTNKTYQTQYDAYKKANRKFLDVIIENYEEGDIVWIHDYHLLFLPQYLKEYNNKIKIGWFLHSPFPSSEVFKTLPSRSELLRSVLTADLLGFHTYDFASHFVRTCTRILGAEGTHEGIVDHGKVTRVAVFPIGIDPNRFIKACELPEVGQQMTELKKRFAGKKVILGVDRLDMIKGIPQKFLGFEKFLEENMDWRDKFAGAAQSLGAGAILVNPWDVTEVSSAIKEALNMPAEERDERHRLNFQYVKTHSAKKWGDDFISELHDTFTESDMKIKKIPVGLPQQDGFFGTLTEPMNNQNEELDLKLNPELKGTLKALCNDPKTTVVVLSRSGKNILDKIFGEYNIWLAAENGMFLRDTTGEWVTNIPENMNLDWVDGTKNVFKYFTDRTPRSFFEASETSLVWNYENADVEFGRAQARDLLQYLWAGPISNASVDVVRGNHSVEVHAVGETKGVAVGRILEEIVRKKSMTTPVDYVFCSGYFLEKDEDIYTFFKPEVMSSKLSHETRSKSSASNHSIKKKNLLSNVLDLKKGNYFSVAIGQAHTKARYVVDSSHDVVDLLHKLAVADTTTSDSFSDSEDYQTRNANADWKPWINYVKIRELAVGDTEPVDI